MRNADVEKTLVATMRRLRLEDPAAYRALMALCRRWTERDARTPNIPIRQAQTAVKRKTLQHR